MLKAIFSGIRAWLDPAPDAIRGRLHDSEKEQNFQLAFVLYVVSFAGIRWACQSIPSLGGGLDYAPTLAALLALLAYGGLYFYRLGQGIPPASHRPRILLVEDDEATVLVVLRFIRSGWDLVLVESVTAALVCLHDGYDWAVVGLNPPYGEGMQILQKVRRDELHTQVVFLSSLPTGPLLSQALSLKPAAVLSKPVNLENLFLVLTRK